MATSATQTYLTPEEYILVSQDKVNIERYLRKPDEWIYTYFQKLEQQLPLTSI